MGPGEYVFEDVVVERELRRLHAIEGVFDPSTQRHLLATGDWLGRHCLEVGAGAGSIAAWMQAQVGAAGRVVAVDTNLRFLGALPPAIELVEGDVRRLELAAGAFDVAHARYVLVHNSEPAEILGRLKRAMKPGAWLLLEEPDFTAARALVATPEARRPFERVHDAIGAMFTGRGLDPALGSRLPALVQQQGFELVAIEADATVERGGSALAQMMSLSTEQLGDKYVATGRAHAEDISGYGTFAGDPSCWAVYYSTVRVLART